MAGTAEDAVGIGVVTGIAGAGAAAGAIAAGWDGAEATGLATFGLGGGGASPGASPSRFIRVSGLTARYPPPPTMIRIKTRNRIRSFMLGGVGPFFPGGPRTTVLSMSDWLGSAAGVGSLAKNMFNPGSAFTESATLGATLITDPPWPIGTAMGV
jgi:hypothetical protein